MLKKTNKSICLVLSLHSVVSEAIYQQATPNTTLLSRITTSYLSCLNSRKNVTRIPIFIYENIYVKTKEVEDKVNIQRTINGSMDNTTKTLRVQCFWKVVVFLFVNGTLFCKCWTTDVVLSVRIIGRLYKTFVFPRLHSQTIMTSGRKKMLTFFFDTLTLGTIKASQVVVLNKDM